MWVRSGNDVFDGGARMLRAGIVACDDSAIRQARRNFPHQGPLAGIAIATAPEHAMQVCGGRKQITQRSKRLLEGIRRMRIVDDDQWSVGRSYHLQATGNRLDQRKRIHGSPEGYGCGNQYGKETEEVCRVEFAEQLAGQMRGSPGSGNFKFQATRGKIQAVTGYFSSTETVAQYVHTRPVDRFRKRATESVVDVYDRMFELRPMEEPRLDGAVVFDGLVIVEMIARQVSEQRHVNFSAVDSALVDAVRRNLHRTARRAAREQPGQVRLQRNCVRRGIDRGIQRSGKSATQRADYCSLASQTRQRLRNPVRTRCLAVGTGDSRNPHFA